MEKRRRSVCAVVAVALVAAMLSLGEAAAYGGGGMSPDYYKTTCPQLEDIVLKEVTRKKNETIVTIPAVLRLFFHDCLVNGCDASVLIASRSADAEKNSPDDDSLAGDGYDTVNRVKAAVEQKCPGVVSCADILALAARDVVHLASGPYWTVELGRLDGLVSKASDVEGKLPDPDMHVKELTDIFYRSGLSQRDMVALSGAHTVGFAHCSRFTKRLYNYSSTVKLDPSFNPEYAKRLMEACPPDVGPTIAVNMDPFSPVVFDNIYYQNLKNGFGLFTSDQVLYAEGVSRKTVEEFAESEPRFFQAFVESMMKVGRLGVKTGNGGEIRRDCTAFNH
ncbi:Peroxidase 55 [Hordeum vulgare]|nr:Peroxidase 55 [Hordeum vulgare]